MLTTETLIFYLALGLLVAAAWRYVGRRFLSDEAVERRRRDRSHKKLISRRHGPAVKLASKVPPEE